MSIVRLLKESYWRMVKRYRPIKFLQHRSEVVRHLFDADIASAKPRDKDQLLAQREFECAEFDDEIRHIESQQWLSRAERVHINVYDISLVTEHEQHWSTGAYGDRYLSDRVLRVLKKLVEDSEYERDKRLRERREIRIKYFTAVVAFLAAMASIVNLLITANKK